MGFMNADCRLRGIAASLGAGRSPATPQPDKRTSVPPLNSHILLKSDSTFSYFYQQKKKHHRKKTTHFAVLFADSFWSEGERGEGGGGN